MKNQIKLLLALCSGLLLAGCSLSSSSSGSGVSPIARDYVLSGGVTAQFAPPPALSSSKPNIRGGDISQSSNVDGNNVTRDLFKVSASGNPSNANYALLYDATSSGSFATLRVATMVVLSPYTSQNGQSRSSHYRRLYGGTVDMNGDGSNDGRLWAKTYADFAVSGTVLTDTDYYSIGWWLYAPSGSADYAMGAFVNRDDVFMNITSVAGTATYSTRDWALYASKHSAEAGQIQFGISLTADFNANKIDGFIEFLGARYPFDQSEPSGFSYNGTIALNKADIMSDSSFSGSGSGMLEEMYQASGSDHKFNQGTRSASVNWGGKFFNNSSSDQTSPNRATGTFAGEIGNDENGIRFVSHFNAHRQSHQQ
jgi:hypothetical protein